VSDFFIFKTKSNWLAAAIVKVWARLTQLLGETPSHSSASAVQNNMESGIAPSAGQCSDKGRLFFL
jgi:hypothetical protein